MYYYVLIYNPAVFNAFIVDIDISIDRGIATGLERGINIKLLNYKSY